MKSTHKKCSKCGPACGVYIHVKLLFYFPAKWHCYENKLKEGMFVKIKLKKKSFIFFLFILFQ